MKKLIEKIKDTLSIFSSSKGFTLLELLVVVLIIGILAAIALPQYKMAVTKSKVASILPIMRRWKDALAEYKLQHGTYCKVGIEVCSDWPSASDLGVNWPSSWKNGNESCSEDANACSDGYWNCEGGLQDDGSVECYVYGNSIFRIIMTQPDSYDVCGGNQDKIICEPISPEVDNICIKLGKPAGENEAGICTQIGG